MRPGKKPKRINIAGATTHYRLSGGDGINLKDFLSQNCADPQLSELICFLGEQCKEIKNGFLGGHAKAGTKNKYGEEQTALDKLADEILTNALKRSGLAAQIATEEQHEIIKIGNPKNSFGIVIDPLDGSSLLGINLAVGTIIGIYPGSVLEPGKKMVGAMYVLYGPMTTLTFTAGNGVHEFAMDHNGCFRLKARDLKIPEGKIYSPGALRREYLPGHATFIERLEHEGYKLRFSGSFVADIHHILHKGGIFAYPGSKGREKGKLRLLFEANPMGKIICEAGGAISNGREDILSIRPSSIEELTPIYAGGKKEVEMLERILASRSLEEK